MTRNRARPATIRCGPMPIRSASTGASTANRERAMHRRCSTSAGNRPSPGMESARGSRDQVLAPIADEREMHLPLARAVEKLRADTTYPAEFARAFGSAEITAEHADLALRPVPPHEGDRRCEVRSCGARREAEFTPEEKRGFELFGMEFDPRLGRRGADCFHCHGGYAFTDYAFHNVGFGDRRSQAQCSHRTRRRSRKIQDPIAAQCRPHRPLHARRALCHARRGGRALRPSA